ncbi:MAG: hypothetical protein IJH91_05045 [Mogibacterium sp.]|nr:hypothetical protein [Mogibacterium sp.]
MRSNKTENRSGESERNMDLTKELKRCRQLHYRLVRRRNRLGAADTIRLLRDERNSGYYYAVRIGETNDTRRYLGTSASEEVKVVQERRFLDRALLNLEKSIRRLEKFGREYRPFDAAVINASLPKAYQLAEDHLREVIGADQAQKWLRQALLEKERLDSLLGVPYPEELKHSAKNGVMMRSKSEVVIANALLDAGIAFVYELPVKVRGKWIRPDFTIYCPKTGRIIYWEHVGMLHSERYRNDFALKMDTYHWAKLVPGVDFLLSFEDLKGNLNSDIIDVMIRELLLEDETWIAG